MRATSGSLSSRQSNELLTYRRWASEPNDGLYRGSFDLGGRASSWRLHETWRWHLRMFFRHPVEEHIAEPRPHRDDLVLVGKKGLQFRAFLCRISGGGGLTQKEQALQCGVFHFEARIVKSLDEREPPRSGISSFRQSIPVVARAMHAASRSTTIIGCRQCSPTGHRRVGARHNFPRVWAT